MHTVTDRDGTQEFASVYDALSAAHTSTLHSGWAMLERSDGIVIRFALDHTHAPQGSEHTEAYPYCSLGCCGMPDHRVCPSPIDHTPQAKVREIILGSGHSA